jgi:hypothetical protein
MLEVQMYLIFRRNNVADNLTDGMLNFNKDLKLNLEGNIGGNLETTLGIVFSLQLMVV